MSLGVVSLVVSAVASPDASLVAINLDPRGGLPQRNGDCGAGILPTTLRDFGVGA
jgi:hypothetical protein